MNTEEHASVSAPHAADFGRRIAALRWAVDAGQDFDPGDFSTALGQMLMAEASTVMDALALAGTLRTALCAIPTDQGTVDPDALDCCTALAARLVVALEIATKTPACAFTGQGPAVN